MLPNTEILKHRSFMGSVVHFIIIEGYLNLLVLTALKKQRWKHRTTLFQIQEHVYCLQYGNCIVFISFCNVFCVLVDVFKTNLIIVVLPSKQTHIILFHHFELYVNRHCIYGTHGSPLSHKMLNDLRTGVKNLFAMQVYYPSWNERVFHLSNANYFT